MNYDEAEKHKPNKNRKNVTSESKAKVPQSVMPIENNEVKSLLQYGSPTPYELTEEPALYKVDKDELQPITLPFMMSGIYKKVPTMPNVVNSNNGNSSKKMSNVFISKNESQGCIMSVKEFHEFYKDVNSYSYSYYPSDEDSEVETPKKRRLLPPIETAVKVGAEIQEKELLDDISPVPKITDLTEIDKLFAVKKYIENNHQKDKVIIDSEKKEILQYHENTNSRTIYRLCSPESLGLESPSQETHSNDPPILNSFADWTVKPKNKPGRPRKDKANEVIIKTTTKYIKTEMKSEETLVPQDGSNQTRTRFGRIVKSKQPTVSSSTDGDPAHLQEKDTPRNVLNFLKDTEYHPGSYVKPKKIDLRQSKLRFQKSNDFANLSVGPDKVTLVRTIVQTEEECDDELNMPQKRHVPPEAICPTCNKIFLGRRLQRHFVQNPDHIKMKPITIDNGAINNQQLGFPSAGNASASAIFQQALSANGLEEPTLFRFLTVKLQNCNLNEDQRAELFLHEVNDLIEQLQMRSSRLIRNTFGPHTVTARVAKVIGIPEGQYALDMSAIQAPPDPEAPESTTVRAPLVNTRSLDYTGISLDNTLTDEAAHKLNLSAGGKLLPPSEESLLRAVGDLVQTDIKNLHSGHLLHPPVRAAKANHPLVPHYDHASDNAVEAVHMKETAAVVTEQTTPMLDLAVDFFEFKNN